MYAYPVDVTSFAKTLFSNLLLVVMAEHDGDHAYTFRDCAREASVRAIEAAEQFMIETREFEARKEANPRE